MFKTRYKISWHYRKEKEVNRLQKQSMLCVRVWCFKVKKRLWFLPFWVGVKVFDDIRLAEKYIDRVSNPDIKKF